MDIEKSLTMLATPGVLAGLSKRAGTLAAEYHNLDRGSSAGTPEQFEKARHALYLMQDILDEMKRNVGFYENALKEEREKCLSPSSS